ncbi:hypothetical protein KUCAC02_020905, partial [Chaenocephalus aceratus]
EQNKAKALLNTLKHRVESTLLFPFLPAVGMLRHPDHLGVTVGAPQTVAPANSSGGRQGLG